MIGKKKQKAPNYEAERRLSPWRVFLAILLLTGLVFASRFSFNTWQDNVTQATSEPWFASYVDVTATPTYNFEQNSKSQVVLSFIVSSTKDSCEPAWGGVYGLDEAGERIDLDRRIARLRQQGGEVAVSFGGLLNDELALKCTDKNKLIKAYENVIDRYDIKVVDFDIEKDELGDKESSVRRAQAIAEIQSKRRTKNESLAVWLTLPVAPQGLTEDGTNAVSYMLDNKVDLAGINVMTMDYGQSRVEGQSMLDASTSALVQAQRQLGILYRQAGITLNSGSLWSKMGATPMIGQNDIPDEVFTTDDAVVLNKFAKDKGVGRMSMWSANRDIQCGSNYVNFKVVSDSCSGVEQDRLEFTTILSNGYSAGMNNSAGVITENDEEAEAELVKVDDPATSPYQIWKESGAYLEGTKVVWRGNVYQAKWWTQGDLPDNPVLQSWQTPWELIGPVMPGEKPIPQATLPAGTYPNWTGDAAYDTGARVLFEGVPYQAKWWNKAQSPAAASSNADASPWAPLTQAQINAIIKTKN